LARQRENLMKKLNANDTLVYLTELLLTNLNDLKECKSSDAEQFGYGSKTAYTECLEVVQRWERAAENRLDFEIGEKFPL